MLRLILQLYYSRDCGIGKGIDMTINKTEQQRSTQISPTEVFCFLFFTKIYKQFNSVRIAFIRNSTEHSDIHSQRKNFSKISCLIQALTQNQ